MSDRPRIGVAVVTFNSADDVGGFVDSIRRCSSGAAIKLLVHDNASTDDTLVLLRREAADLDLEVIESKSNLGYAAGINAMASRLEPDVPLLVLNPDTRLDVGAVRALMSAAGPSDVGVVVPRLVDEHGRTLPSLRRDPSVARALAEAVLGGRRAARLGVSEVVTASRAYDRPGEVDWATGAALLVTPRARARVPSWDESFFLYSEETDYLQRVRSCGLRVVFEPSAVVRHRGGAAHTNPDLWTLLTLNRVKHFSRHHGPRRLAFYLAVLLNECVRAPGSLPHRRAAAALVRRAPEVLRGTL